MCSDRQYWKIRKALRAYKSYGKKEDGKPYSWEDVHAAIAHHTGYEIGKNQKLGAENIRKFVEGVPENEGETHFPKPKWVSYALKFLADDRVDLLSEDELEEFVPPYKAPLLLLSYLDEMNATERLIPTATLEGVYLTKLEDEDGVINRELILQKPSKDGLIQVLEREEIHTDTTLYNPETANKNAVGEIKYGGWAILTPEDNILIFLKDKDNGRNKYYITLAIDNTLWTDGCMEYIVVLDHKYPFELKEHHTDVLLKAKSKVLQDVERNIRFYKRAPMDLSGKTSKG